MISITFIKDQKLKVIHQSICIEEKKVDLIK